MEGHNFLHVMAVLHKECNGKEYTVAFCRDFPGGGWKNFRRLYEGTYSKEQLESDDAQMPVAQFGLTSNPLLRDIDRRTAYRIIYDREEV